MSEPFSRQSVEKASRLRGATVTEGLCPYCAVGCGQLIYTKGGKLIDIEGNPDSPINRGTLCPKGAATYQLVINPNRVTKVWYRASGATEWDKTPMAYNVVPPTDEDGNPEGASPVEKAAATRLAKSLNPDASGADKEN